MTTAIQAPGKLLLTQAEAAEVLGISQRALFDLSSPRGPIPTVRIGRSVRFSVESLEKWVAKQESAKAS